MKKEIKEKIEQFHMIQKGDRILLGISGGADSVCLGQVLWELRGEYDLFLGAVYCHHGIRGKEADEDGAFVKEFCKSRGIAFYEVYEKVEMRAKTRKLSVEEAGREFRYETFEKVMKEDRYNVLAIAHNANDRAETMLFHLARGTGLMGLSTMEPVRKFTDSTKLIRPLLWTTREQIEAWLIHQNISWRTDSTNLSDDYTRNQIRHQILPQLTKINEQAVRHMGETAEKMGEAVDYFKTEEDKMINECVSCDLDGNRIIIDIPKFEKHHLFMKKSVLYRLLSEVSGSKKDITSLHTTLLLDLLEGQSGRESTLGKGIAARKEYDRLILARDCPGEKESEKRDVLPEIHMERKPFEGEEILKNKYTKYFDCDKIRDNLVVRFWQEGDYLFLREDGGKKKLGRYFIDEKIPKEERKKIPLLADGHHILWVIGYRISAYYKVTDKTKNMLIVNVQNKG